MDLQLSGKRVMVTGGASGIGLATAQLFCQEGARVAIADVDADRGHKACRWLRGEAAGGRTVLFEPMDASDPQEVTRAFDSLLGQLGGLDILVNNAGVYMSKPVLELSAEEWDRIMAVNLRSVFLCSQAGARAMEAGGGGSIVNLGSVGGQTGSIVSGANYSTSKAGVICLTKTLAKQLTPLGIRVNVVNPGVVDTPMTRNQPPADRETTRSAIPLGRYATPDEVAAVVVFIASPVASHVHGTHVDVNGGMYMD